jgi:hypothetical protein
MTRIFAFAFALASAPVIADASTLINFDNLSGGDNVTTQYAGVTFSDALVANFPLAGYSAPNFIRSLSSAYQPQQGSPISAVFASAVSSVSLLGLDIGANGFILKAFDSVSGGNLLALASFTGSDIGVGTFQSLTVSAAGILRVEFSQITNVGGGDGMGFDDFSYDVSEVPVPATLPLGLAGVAAFGFVARRRKSV